MGITNKYELETVNYGTTGWNALNASSFQTLDDQLHTYLRYPVASTETIAQYDPVTLINGEWHKALADGAKMPAMAIAIEAGVSGEYLRAQRIGPLTNAGWSFVPSGEVYLTASGELSQTKPGSNTQIVGFAIASNIIMVNPSVEVDVGTGSGGDYVPTSYLVTTVGDPGSDTSVPTEQAVREALVGLVSGEYIPTSYLTTSVGTPGSDVKVPTEQAVRESLASFVSGEYIPTSYLVTEIGVFGSDTSVPTEQAVREALVPANSPDEVLWNDNGDWGGTTEFRWSSSGEFLYVKRLSVAVASPSEEFDIDGAIRIVQGSAPSPTTDKLYNVGGNIYWNGTALGGGGGGGETYSGEAIYTKTDNYTVTSGELNGVFAMNAATEKTFTLCSVGAAQNGKKAIFQKLGAGKLNIVAVDTDKIGWTSSAPGTLFNNQADELGASVTLRYSDTITTWIIECAVGTWGVV